MKIKRIAEIGIRYKEEVKQNERKIGRKWI